MKRDVFTNLNDLARIALNIANYMDEKGLSGEESELNRYVGLGWGAASTELRRGVQAIAEIQGKYREALFQKQLAETSETEALDFVEDIFGDREADSVNDEIKEKLRAAFAKIEREWEENWEKEWKETHPD